MGGHKGKVYQVTTGQEMFPDESRADLSIHCFWKWGTFNLFDIQIFNLDASSYLFQTSAKALETVEKEKKEKCLHPRLERRHTFTAILYFADRITGMENKVAQQRLYSLKSNKVKQ